MPEWSHEAKAEGVEVEKMLDYFAVTLFNIWYKHRWSSPNKPRDLYYV